MKHMIMAWKITRWLHIGLAVGASLQLLCSLVMNHPDDNSTPIGDLLTVFHQTNGIIVAGIVLLNVIWALILRGDEKKRQIAVLFALEHWKEAYAVLKKLPAALIGKTAFIPPYNRLSMIVEMLGLLTMAGIASTGMYLPNSFGCTCWVICPWHGCICVQDIDLLHVFYHETYTRRHPPMS